MIGILLGDPGWEFGPPPTSLICATATYCLGVSYLCDCAESVIHPVGGPSPKEKRYSTLGIIGGARVPLIEGIIKLTVRVTVSPTGTGFRSARSSISGGSRGAGWGSGTGTWAA